MHWRLERHSRFLSRRSIRRLRSPISLVIASVRSESFPINSCRYSPGIMMTVDGSTASAYSSRWPCSNIANSRNSSPGSINARMDCLRARTPRGIDRRGGRSGFFWRMCVTCSPVPAVAIDRPTIDQTDCSASDTRVLLLCAKVGVKKHGVRVRVLLAIVPEKS